MRYLLQFLSIAAATLFLLYVVIQFALSDFRPYNFEIAETKPWRPYARLVFGAVAVPIILFFMGWFCKACYRDRPPI